jgi:tRNA1Val (adenine37-N6)-methyltransferase
VANTYFQFKQFKINQDKSSMKVCTDSCLFGAWVADKIETKMIAPKNVLDIGAGTGLLSLMLAQKSFAEIDAIEIDEHSMIQAQQNFAESQWHDRLHIIRADIRNWISPKKYDLVICNPPFYENDLRSSNQKKNIAKHHDALTLDELAGIAKLHLQDNGKFAVLLPFHRIEAFIKVALKNDLHLNDALLVKQTPRHRVFRGILLFGVQKIVYPSNELIIKNEEGNYTPEFNFLLKDYYL